MTPSTSDPRIAFFADKAVGLGAVAHALEHRKKSVAFVMTTSENEIATLTRRHGCSVFPGSAGTAEWTASLSEVDWLFLAWWPSLVPEAILLKPKKGVVNFHPSLLPHNRGKHYNFWTLVEGTPFGVTLHLVDKGIDSGPILFQKPIEKTWEDTGKTLFEKAQTEMLALFKEHFVDILEGRYEPKPQDLSKGSLHYARELEPASVIDLDRPTTARELLNRLRARTFPGHPACSFIDEGEKYEVRVTITEVKNERR